VLARRAPPAPPPPVEKHAIAAAAPAPPRPPQPFGAAPRPPARDPPAPARPQAVDDALVQEVLCTVAEEKLREGWRRDRDEIARNLRRSLADADEQEKNVRDNAAELATVLGLEAAQRDDFTARYRERRLARVADARAALD